jgi:hypothetical protein
VVVPAASSVLWARFSHDRTVMSELLHKTVEGTGLIC